MPEDTSNPWPAISPSPDHFPTLGFRFAERQTRDGPYRRILQQLWRTQSGEFQWHDVPMVTLDG